MHGIVVVNYTRTDKNYLLVGAIPGYATNVIG
jgi:hypothetical protein